MSHHDLEEIYSYIDQHLDQHVARLQSWVRQRSISNTGEGMRAGAELTASFFADLGCQRVEVVDVGITKWGVPGHPVVYGEYDADKPKTLLLYMMYDTMPVWDLEDWIAPPFEARLMELPPFKQVLVGRGACNSKGPLMAILNALSSIKAVTGELPVNLILVAEGDEERMSVGLHKFVHEHVDRLRKADALLAWGTVGANGMGKLIAGSEGCVYFELETSGARWGRGPASSNVHGHLKRIVDSPAWRHIKMLSTLVSDDGNRVQVDGWYDDVEPLTESDRKMLLEAESYFDLDAAGKRIDLGSFMQGLTNHDVVRESIFGTTFNLDGIWGGLTEPGTAGAVLPANVTSKHDCRYVSNQNGEDLLRKIRSHLDRHGYSDVAMRVLGDVPWVNSRYDTEIAQAVARMYETFGVEYVKLPGPGIACLGPYWPAYLFARDPLQIPIAMAGIDHGGGVHAMNEYYVIEGNERIHGYSDAQKAYASALYYYAGLA